VKTAHANSQHILRR